MRQPLRHRCERLARQVAVAPHRLGERRKPSLDGRRQNFHECDPGELRRHLARHRRQLAKCLLLGITVKADRIPLHDHHAAPRGRQPHAGHERRKLAVLRRHSGRHESARLHDQATAAEAVDAHARSPAAADGPGEIERVCRLERVLIVDWLALLHHDGQCVRPAIQPVHAGGDGEGQLCAAAEPHVGPRRCDHLDLARCLLGKAPRLRGLPGEAHRPLGERPAAEKRLRAAQPHVHAGSIDHHAHAAKRPHLGIAKR